MTLNYFDFLLCECKKKVEKTSLLINSWRDQAGWSTRTVLLPLSLFLSFFLSFFLTLSRLYIVFLYCFFFLPLFTTSASFSLSSLHWNYLSCSVFLFEYNIARSFFASIFLLMSTFFLSICTTFLFLSFLLSMHLLSLPLYLCTFFFSITVHKCLSLFTNVFLYYLMSLYACF